MKLSELIARYGDDDVQFQMMDNCTQTLTMTKKGTKAVIATPVRFDLDGFEKLGIIVWLDRAEASKLLAEEQA